MNSRFSEITTALKIELDAKADQPSNPQYQLPACKCCHKSPNISFGQKTKRYFAAHSIDCRFSAVWGDTQEQVKERWVAQQKGLE